MATSDDKGKAERLAKAILSDLELYDEVLIESSMRNAQTLDELIAKLDEPIQKGRALFTRRVAPELSSVFDEMLRQRLGDRLLKFSK
jgi:hypothetical protein